MTGPQAFLKRPVQIDAWQWDGTVGGATQIINWITANGGTARYHEREIQKSFLGDGEPTVILEHIAIDTLEGTMRANRGDWIIMGVKGEFYPCRADIFAQTYTTAGDPIASSTARIAEEIAAGRRKAHEKHGDTSIEGSGNDFEFLAILVEEVGEAAEALNDHRHDPEYPFTVRLRAELIDVAVVAVAWAAAIDTRRAAEC